jgi:hypothetical protein
MIEPTTSKSSRHRRPGVRTNTFGGRLDRLITLVAVRRRLENAERPLRMQLAAEMTARHRQGGPNRFRRPGGLISLVAPPPRWNFFDEQTFAKWLVASGHGHLVTERVVVTDHADLVALLRGAGRSGRVSQRKLNACLTVQLEVNSDAPEHLDATVRNDGMLFTRDGEVIPGVRRILREPWVQVIAAAPVA